MRRSELGSNSRLPTATAAPRWPARLYPATGTSRPPDLRLRTSRTAPRQARYPYLDEDVVATLAALPLPLLCDLRQEAGRGDKLVLRRLARNVGLTRCASLQKRAIQFGTRIANKNVCGEALLGPEVSLDEIVHPAACAAAAPAQRSRPREALAKPRNKLPLRATGAEAR